MTESTFYERLSKIISDRHLSQTDAAKIAGVSQGTISRITSEDGKKEVTNIDGYINLCISENDKHYLATGKHLDTNQEQPAQCTSEIKMLNDTIKDLSKIITQLSAKMDQLSAEISHMREENKLGMKRAREKIPDH